MKVIIPLLIAQINAIVTKSYVLFEKNILFSYTIRTISKNPNSFIPKVTVLVYSTVLNMKLSL